MNNMMLDVVDRNLLTLLQADARISFRQLGREVGLSAPAVAERVRRLEDAGVITGYHAAVNPARIGLPITALLRLSGVGDRGVFIHERAAAMPEVLECHRLTGSDSYVLKVVAASIPHLETLIDAFVPYSEVTTALVLATPVERRTVVVPGR